MGFDGSFWNPSYRGEGFAFNEYADGTVIVYFYSYGEDGKQLWLIGVGKPDGDSLTVDMYVTEGGSMMAATNPANVIEDVWGEMRFQLTSGGAMVFESHAGGYELLPLHVANGEPDPEPEPEPPDVVVEHKLGNTWHPLNVPVVGTIQGITTTQIRNKHLVREYRITSDEPLNLSQSTFNHDPAYNLNPSIQISGNNVRLYLGPSNSSFPSLTKHAGFKVQDATHGVLIEVSAQVAGA